MYSNCFVNCLKKNPNQISSVFKNILHFTQVAIFNIPHMYWDFLRHFFLDALEAELHLSGIKLKIKILFLDT